MAIMASFGYIEVIISVICLLLLFRFSQSNRRPWNWPLLGMLPMLFLHFHRLNDKFAEILKQNGGTFLLKGAWFTNMDMLFTSNPANVNHIMSKNFLNYPKGLESKRIFDILGDILFNSDLDEWRSHRKMARAFFNDRRFFKSTANIIRDSLEKGLIPVLEQVTGQGLVFDLQDLFKRFMFDATCSIITGYDPGSFRIELPEVPFSKATDDAGQVMFLRHLLPEKFWKLQRCLGFGAEKKMSRAQKTLDDIAEKYIMMKQEQLRKVGMSKKDEECYDALKCYLTEDEIVGSKAHPYNTLRDTVIGLVFAGQDTTSAALTWFFWLVLKNPSVEFKIREELKANLPLEESEKYKLFSIEEVNKLAYLHGALCETLRLYPPVPFQRRVSIQSDILPSGHHVNPSMKVVLSSYAMGRMASIWGNDCLEFKPERWVTEKGEIKHELSKKFFAFSAGPRICPGKEFAFTSMKAVAAAIIHNYHVQGEEGYPVTPVASIILRMKHGLMVRVTKRRA